jgi:tRNA modification GTPase
MKDQADTICALSTPPGRSGIAIVRVSGLQSHSLFQRIFVPDRIFDQLPLRHALLGKVRDPIGGGEVDEAIAICSASPNSYTGEDMVEFSLHGSPVLITVLLESLCKLGARLADPGEFTMRAFLHGRLDLSQAEAINDVINATTLFQAQVAGRQRSGALARQLKPLKEMLIQIEVNLESAVEFAEEDLALDSRDSIAQQLGHVRRQLIDWIESYRRGRVIKEGISMAIVGRPNVGKSSLFNALLAQNRSIVAEMPGTTRDLISEFTSLGGIPVRLLDTAGIQSTEDHVEKMGIERSYQAIADADAILFVVDVSQPPTQQDWDIRQHLADFSCMVIFNKLDMGICWSKDEKRSLAGCWPEIEASAKTGFGIRELQADILHSVLGVSGVDQESVFVTNLRHLRSLEEAKLDLDRACNALQNGLSEEFALIDLRNCLRSLGTITGESSVEDLLGEIFSRFCIGK